LFYRSFFFSVIQFSFYERNGSDQATNVYSIVITERLAKKLFGNGEALNKIIQIDSADNFIVSGSIKGSAF
jgi:hypothetical protein